MINNSLAASGEVIKGLEKSKPNSTTNKPTTLSVLQKFVSEQMTISKIILSDKTHYYMTSQREELKKYCDT